MVWAIIYIISAVLCYGFSFAHFQNNDFPLSAKDRYFGDMAVSIIFGLCSVPALVGMYAGAKMYGKRFYCGFKFV